MCVYLLNSWTGVLISQKWICNGCEFLEWIDPRMCKRSVQVIPRLLRKRNKLEQELGHEKEFDLVDGLNNVGESMVNWGKIEAEVKNMKVILLIIVALLLYVILFK